jgi:hypothetical protein
MAAPGAPLSTPLVLSKRTLGPEWRARRSAATPDVGHYLSGSFTLHEQDGEAPTLRAVYLAQIAPRWAPLLEGLDAGLRTLSFVTDWRTDGLFYTARTFGYQPRNSIRRDYCSNARMSRTRPTVHNLLLQGAQIAAEAYAQYAPDHYAAHQEAARRLLPEWRIGQTPFTSGIVNFNSPLQYHVDRGNFPGVLSCQLTFRLGRNGGPPIQDGYLALPEYDLGIALGHHSLLLFDGQHTLHGVTPLSVPAQGGYRFTVVYYALAGMWNCAPLAQELRRIQVLRTERESRGASRQREP